MTAAALPNSSGGERKPPNGRVASAPAGQGNATRIPGSFQLLLALYTILTGTLPTIIEAMAFGVQSGSGSEFAAAMATGLARDILLLVPLFVLANHPLGILHPLLLAVVVWPLLIHMPTVIQDWGGWAGILGGSPVSAPQFTGLPSRSPSLIWGGIAKFNGVQILGLVSTYIGFWAYSGRQGLSRRISAMRSTAAIKPILLALVALSLIVLFLYLRTRGGLNEHLTSLGGGRFKQLSGDGAVMVIIDVGAIALMLWVAARPGDIKTPAFLASMAAVTAAEFVSNGSRGAALLVPLMVGLVWAVRRQRIPWKVALLLVPIMFVSIGLLGAVRMSSWTGSSADQAFANTGWSESFRLAEREVAGRVAVSANVPVVMRGYTVSDGPLLGRSYVVAFTAFVPRPLWPDKPRGVGQLYARLFLGASMAGTSIPVHPTVEMYWNFGFPGVVLLSLFYGMLLRVVFEFFWRRYPDPFATVFYVLFITSFHFSSDRLVGLEQRSFILLFCYLIVAVLVPTSQARPDTRHLAQRRILSAGGG